MTTGLGGLTSRRSTTLTNSSHATRAAAASENGGAGVGNTSHTHRKSISASRFMGLTGERTVKRLRLSKALTIPDTTNINEACRRMAACRVDALLLTDSNALLCGILTAKDIATRVIAREETTVSKVMTRNPVYLYMCFLAPLLLKPCKKWFKETLDIY